MIRLDLKIFIKQSELRLKTIGILFFIVFNVLAVYGQHNDLPRFNLKLNSATIEKFSSEIEKNSNYKFFFDASKFDSLRVTINTEDQTLTQLLDEIFKATTYLYVIDERMNVFLTKNEVLATSLPSSLFNNTTYPVNSTLKTPQITDLTYKDEQTAIVKNATLESKVYEVGTRAKNPGQEKIILSGYIKDADTGEPLSGTYLYTENNKTMAITNERGFYSLELPSGNHTLTIKNVGQRETTRKVILYSDGYLNIDIKNSLLSLREVVVTQKSNNLQRTQLGLEKINIQAIKQIPTVFGEADILKALLTLPGVKTVGEASGGFNVRGGATDQNLILFNEATIYNPTHFFGFFSAFNPDVVKDVELFKSSLPVKYGGRLSSVINVNSREGNKKKFAGTAGIGLLTSRLNIEGPLIKDKTSFILGGRTTYSNFIFKLLPSNAGYKDSKASFNDLNLLLNHKINEKNSLYFTGYLSNDNSNLGTDTTYGYANRNASLKWAHIFNQKLTSTFVTGYDGYQYQNEANRDSINAYKLNFDINQFYLKSAFTYYLNSKHTLDFGLHSIYYKLHPGSFKPQGNASLIRPKLLDTEQAVENSFYLGDTYELSPAISFNFGVRYTHFTNLGPQKVYKYAPGLPKEENNRLDSVFYKKGQITQTYHGPEFRFSSRFLIGDNLSIKAGYNSLRQYIHMLSNTTAISPTDIWKLSDPNIKPQFGDQVSLGLYKNFKNNAIETSFEVYYKRIKNYLDYKSGAQLILNQNLETDVINTQGKAFGFEFSVKKTIGKLNGWFSYTYSRTFLKMDDPTVGQLINNGNYYPASFDKPHDATIVGNYKFSRRISFSANVTYSTGRPITIPIGAFIYEGSQRALYGDRNGYRIPDYFRSDISLNLDGNHKVDQLTHSSWTFGIYNLTGRRNAYSTFFTSEQGRINGYKLSIFGSAVPFINYNIRF
nr:carboxypeptidase-like regulatory domain-containing protein [uncultured Pedobacter sp.]